MNSKLAFGLGLVVGALGGAGVTYSIISKSKDEEKELEVSSIRESFDARIKEINEKNRIEKEKMTDKVLDEYAALIKERGYSTESQIEEVKEPEKEPKEEKENFLDALIAEHEANKVDYAPVPSTQEPYLISYDEFGEIDGYNQRNLMYYANGIMVEDDYEVIEDPENIIGKEILDKLLDFAENGEYIVWVRNNDLLTDFEIQIAEYDFTD